MLKPVVKESNWQFRYKGRTTSDRPISRRRLTPKTSRKRRRAFLLSRGFVACECVTYRWGMQEGRYQAPPIFYDSALNSLC